MKILDVIFLFLFSLFFQDYNNNEIEIQIKEGSHLFIKGTSNVNTFTCSYLKPIVPKTFILEYEDLENGWEFEDAQLQLESTAFDCGGRRINKDFKELIKTSEFPSIEIDVSEVTTKGSNFLAAVQISIAGKTQSIPVEISLKNQDSFIYTSVLRLNLEDFNLELPSKMMGLIQVHEEISIHINLHLDLGLKD